MLIVESQSLDVYRNLAIEEVLMDEVREVGPVLFLWRSGEAVVMGKNQNPWRECRLGLMRAEGVPLARRVSGGGTVYHDAGNLNYCVITGREEYCECDAYNMVFRALETFGIQAEKTGKSNLSVDGLKFSGNAFAFRKGRALHHGTLLLETDLEKLNRYLGSMLDGIETHAIASVPARVMNLGVSRNQLADALKKSFAGQYGEGEPVEWTDGELDEALVKPVLDRQHADTWQFEATPRFSVTLSGKRVDVVKGRVAEGEHAGKAFSEIAFSLVC